MDGEKPVTGRDGNPNNPSKIKTVMITHSPPSIRQAFNFAWITYKEHVGLFTAVVLTFFASWVILESVVVAGQKYGLLLWTIAHLSFFIFFAGLEIGFIQVCLAMFDKKQITYSHIFQGLQFSAIFFAVQSIYLVIVLAGLVLLIIPGIYFGILYSLFGFYFVDNNSDLKQSFQQSAAASQGSMRFLLLFIMAAILFNILGASLLGIGLIVTIPLSTLMTTSIYRQLKKL